METFVDDPFLISLRGKVLEQWTETWRNLQNNKLRQIKPAPRAWPSSIRGSRAEEVAITRIRIGHCAMTHSYLFSVEKNPPQCDKCECPITIEHLLLYCKKYDVIRDSIGIRGSLETVIGDDHESMSRIISFLRRTGLFIKF